MEEFIKILINKLDVQAAQYKDALNDISNDKNRERNIIAFSLLITISELIEESWDRCEEIDILDYKKALESLPKEKREAILDGEPGILELDDKRAVNPDIFRDQLEEMVEYIEDTGRISAHSVITQEAINLLEKHPISPARAVEAKYEGVLRECRKCIINILTVGITDIDGRYKLTERIRIIQKIDKVIND